MRKNLIKESWQRDEPVVNGWLTLPTSITAEVMAHEGWDALTIDLQHGLIDYQTAVTILQAISTTNTVPLVRVPWLEPGIIMKVLDAGAYGVICPMINSAEEAARFVAACRYPPAGIRSCGPIRANVYAGPGYVAGANDQIVTMAMIETRPALERLDEILSVDQLDAIYVGPSDLSISLGYPPRLDSDEPEVVAAVDFILSRAQERKIFAGIHTESPAYAQKMIQKGFRFVTIGSDLRLLTSKVGEVLRLFGKARPGTVERLTPTGQGPY
ncbi:MAG: 2,4-dihydroxyhept-2-ene-1,7-dioic acid aldolase [Verrucomicrobia bacterium]|nr:2,4-dihydroxyhept-2-ene-1,7-dioic acid aldolase [Verrucomicrobiota bacterium]